MDTHVYENSEESDPEMQEKMFEIVKGLSLILSNGVPIYPPGRTDRELASMSVDNHSPRILELMLSAGVPLYGTDGRHSILEKSWLNMTSTTKEAVIINRVSNKILSICKTEKHYYFYNFYPYN